MEEFTNYTLSELYRLPEIESDKTVEEIEAILSRYGAMAEFMPKLKTKRDLFSMTLREVDQVKTILSSEDTTEEEIFSLVELFQGIKAGKAKYLDFQRFYGYLNHIREQVRLLYEREDAIFNTGEIDKKWMAVNGSERMGVYGIYNTLDELSNGDITKYDAIMDMEYSEIFTILAMRRTKTQLQKEMHNLKLD